MRTRKHAKGSEARLRVANLPDAAASRTIYVEPWGDDYTLPPGEQLEIVAFGRKERPTFSIQEHDTSTSIWLEGDAYDFAVKMLGVPALWTTGKVGKHDA